MTFSIELEQETDGRWIAEVPDPLAFLPTDRRSLRPRLEYRLWRFVSSPTAWSTAKPALSSQLSHSPRHDFVAERSLLASTRCALSNWLDNQAPGRIPPRVSP